MADKPSKMTGDEDEAKSWIEHMKKKKTTEAKKTVDKKPSDDKPKKQQ